MVLLVLVALTGAITIMMLFKITRWWELIVIGTWGVLGTVIVYNGDLASLTDTISSGIGAK